LATANPASSASTATFEVSRPTGPLVWRASPSPSSTVQAASSAVRTGRSVRDASSGAIASQASGAMGWLLTYWTTANAATAAASGGPATRQDRRGLGRPVARPGFSGACVAAAGTSAMRPVSPPHPRRGLMPASR
jgi:hypothetical protein